MRLPLAIFGRIYPEYELINRDRFCFVEIPLYLCIDSCNEPVPVRWQVLVCSIVGDLVYDVLVLQEPGNETGLS